jgi:hypothetical protein
MTGSVLLLVLLGSMVLGRSGRSPARDARDTALRMRAMLEAALADAEVDGGEVVVRADAADGPRGARFLALAGPAGVTTDADPAAEWVALEGGVAWRSGGAGVDPLGAPTDGRVPGTVRCSPEACAVGAAGYAVYHVGHVRRAGAAWALVLTAGREVRLFRWDGAAGAWEAGS